LVDLYGIDVLIPDPKCCPFYAWTHTRDLQSVREEVTDNSTEPSGETQNYKERQK